ncbi:MAG: NHL repeat-containing protein [Paludibacter sp.]|nr:NHL repeat-containing protein [Paludibacter sp.]
MKKNTLTYILIIAIIAALIVMGNYFIKPRYDKETVNPYSLKIDSIGEIAAQNYCDVTSSTINIRVNEAIAITVDNNNNIYVSGDNKIIIYSPKGEKTNEFATETTATALVMTEKNVLIAAFKNNVEVYSSEGKLIQKWSDLSEHAYITSVAVKNEKIYLADAESALVYVYTLDGKLLKTIGNKVNKEELSSFILPSFYFDVAIGTDSTLWVANTGRHKLVNFNDAGEILYFWGETSSGVDGFCGCCNPSHFAIMNDGSFITAEKGIVRVKKYSENGKFECAIAGPKHFEQGSTGLDIAINSDNEILVLEPLGKKIHVFKLKK